MYRCLLLDIEGSNNVIFKGMSGRSCKPEGFDHVWYYYSTMTLQFRRHQGHYAACFFRCFMFSCIFLWAKKFLRKA